MHFVAENDSFTCLTTTLCALQCNESSLSDHTMGRHQHQHSMPIAHAFRLHYMHRFFFSFFHCIYVPNSFFSLSIWPTGICIMGHDSIRKQSMHGFSILFFFCRFSLPFMLLYRTRPIKMGKMHL